MSFAENFVNFAGNSGRDTQDTYIRREQAPNRVNYRVHMEPFSMLHSMLHFAFNPFSIHYILRDHPNTHELTNHILHSVGSIRPAVAGCSRKDVVPVVRNGSGVTNRHNRKFSQDNFDGDDVENRFLAVKLIHNPRTDRLQPTCDGIMCIIAIIAIMSIIVIQLL